MTREEIIKEIEKLKADIFYEDMKDYGWNGAYVRKCQNRIKELEEELEAM